ncbi:MAG: hypothetical protein KDA52_06995 [Planctomycetaceae bacterium]|nr:hypothetical protein [Planctomycetaceae bacterium]
MTTLIPPEFLFRYTFPVQQIKDLPRRGKRLLNLPTECTLPSLSELARRQDYGRVQIAWNDRGFGISVSVDGKTHPPVGDPEKLGVSDGIRVWIDTRCTQTVHRASRFCHQFEFLPVGGGEDGMQPVATMWPVARASDDPPEVDSDLLPIQSDVREDGYRLEAWLPAEALFGYDPVEQPKLGFMYLLNDSERGLQCLSIGEEFPIVSDPSLWCTLELTSEVQRR